MNRMQFLVEGFKAISSSDVLGTFEGYASIFGNVDLGYDVVMQGAFKEIVRGRNGKVKVLLQHDPMNPIGTADVIQDSKGLSFKGELVLTSSQGRDAYELMKAGALDGMSIGYDVLPDGQEMTEGGVRRLTGLKLWEISPVTWGMNPEAGVDGVKGLRPFKGATVREFETYLRDVAGFSQADAKATASAGFSSRDHRDGEDETQSALQQFKNAASLRLSLS